MGVITILTDCTLISDEIRNIMYKFIPHDNKNENHWIRTVNIFSSPIDEAIIRQGLTYQKKVNDFDGGQVIYFSNKKSKYNLSQQQINYIRQRLSKDNICFFSKIAPAISPAMFSNREHLCKKYCFCLSEACVYCGIKCDCNKKNTFG